MGCRNVEFELVAIAITGLLVAKACAQPLECDWHPLPNGLTNRTFAATFYNGSLYAGTGSCCNPATGILFVQSQKQWSPVNILDYDDSGDSVSALEVFDFGDGSTLFIGGSFATGIVQWNGTESTPLAGGVDGSVYAIAIHDDGSGPAIFAAGRFEQAGGISARNIAKWDGSSWVALGLGVGNANSGGVQAMGTYGSSLFVAGDFGVKSWNGTQWNTLSLPVNNDVFAITEFEQSNGVHIAVFGGEFSGGLITWDGQSFSTLGDAQHPDEVHSLEVLDINGTSHLLAGGRSWSSDLAMSLWDGKTWTQLGDDLLGGQFGGPPWVLDAAVDSNASNTIDLVVVGEFDVDQIASPNAVRLLCNSDAPCLPDLNGDGTLNFFDVSEFLVAFAQGLSSADFSNDGTLNFFDVARFLELFNSGCR